MAQRGYLRKVLDETYKEEGSSVGEDESEQGQYGEDRSLRRHNRTTRL